jgi:hypothetical protein
MPFNAVQSAIGRVCFTKLGVGVKNNNIRHSRQEVVAIFDVPFQPRARRRKTGKIVTRRVCLPED